MPDKIDLKRVEELVRKYDRPGPRYTSYPTAPEWRNDYDPAEYIEALKKASGEVDEPLSFYLHIPYCRKRCWFCGCNTMVSKGPEGADEYLSRIEKETDMVLSCLGSRKKISQFHWGGGTPSFLTDAQTVRAYEIFFKRFEMLKDAEISIELDPRVTGEGRIRLLKSLGFNRLSMGIQDFNSEVQSAIGRNQDEKMAVDLYRFCRSEGFTGINFDLIYGLPMQTIDSFRETLVKVIELRPDRVAMYSYAHLPAGKVHQKKINEAALPTPQTKSDLFHLAREMFQAGGYIQIGMDHFVRPTDELAQAASQGKLRRNFMGYTVNAAKDWIGVGMSSISYVSNNFAQNHSGIGNYNRAIDSGHFAVYRGLKLNQDDLIRQYLISEIMCNFQVDFSESDRRFGIESRDYLNIELQELQPFIDDGLIIRDNDSLHVTGMGKIFVRNIAMVFDAYLRKAQDGPKVQFSRTI